MGVRTCDGLAAKTAAEISGFNSLRLTIAEKDRKSFLLLVIIVSIFIGLVIVVLIFVNRVKTSKKLKIQNEQINNANNILNKTKHK